MLPVSDAVTKGWMAAVNGPVGPADHAFPHKGDIHVRQNRPEVRAYGLRRAYLSQPTPRV